MMKSVNNKNHTAKDLSGVQIDHSMQELQEGHEYIMTFKDTPVIIGNEMNEEDELLENIELQSQFRQKLNAKKQTDFNTGQNYNNTKMLPQYDDEDEETAQKKANRIILSTQGDSGQTKEQKLEELREKLNFKGKTKVSLEVQKNINSDYLQVSEASTANGDNQVAKFKKSKKMAGRKRQAEEDIVSILEQANADEDQTSGLGTREQKQVQLKQERQDSITKKTWFYFRQLQAEEEFIKQRNYERAQSRMKQLKRPKLADDFAEDEYSMIENQLEKQRRLKIKENRPVQAEHFIQQALISQSNAVREDDGEVEVISTQQISQNPDAESIQSISKEFAIKTSEQTNGQVQQIAGTQSFSISQARDGFTSVVNIQLPSQRIREAAKQSENKFSTPLVPTNGQKVEKQLEEVKKDTAATDQDMKDIADLEEKLVGKGIGNALMIFRDRKMLGKQKVFGRNKEKSLEQQLKSFGDTKNQEEDRVKLEYFDKKGKKITLKEAFRQMCWKFHGKMPSHRKQEKRKLQEEMESKQNQISVGLNPNFAAPRKLGGSLGSLSSSTKKTKKI